MSKSSLDWSFFRVMVNGSSGRRKKDWVWASFAIESDAHAYAKQIKKESPHWVVYVKETKRGL